MSVLLHDHFHLQGWLTTDAEAGSAAYNITPKGKSAFALLGIDTEAVRATRRRFAYGCLDWSERRPHLGGQLGAAFLKVALKKRWVVRELDSRVLQVTSLGRRDILARFGLYV